MSLTITRATNGYVITDEEGAVTVIAEDPSHPNPDALAAHLMLWEVNESIGHIGSRYDEYRVTIRLEHGDKWMSPDEESDLLDGTPI